MSTRAPTQATDGPTKAPPSAAGSLFSDEARLLVRPFVVYRELRERSDAKPLRTIAGRILRTQLLVAGAVALITAGRLPLHLLVGTAVFWSMVPVLQTAMALGGHLVSNRRMPRTRAVGLHMAGNAPMLLWLLLCAGICLFSPDVYAAFTWALRPIIAPGLVLAFVWGSVLSFAFYRAALEQSRARAALSLFVEIVLKIGLIVAWYMAIDNIVPQLSGSVK